MLYIHRFPSPLLPGRLIRRFNRFMADVELESGEQVVAHCVNTGRMEGLTKPGLRVWLSRAANPKRQLQFTWEITEIPDYSTGEPLLVGTNTAFPNQLVGTLLRERLIPGLDNYEELTAEARYGENSRVDFLLRRGRKLHYVEVKNCHLTYPDRRGYFPDSVSERAAKHLEELAEMVTQGHRATVLFTAQRGDTRCVRPSDVHDPAFAAAARHARTAGVQFKALLIRPTPEAMIVEKMIPVDLKPYALARPQKWMESGRAEGPAWVIVKPKAPPE